MPTSAGQNVFSVDLLSYRKISNSSFEFSQEKRHVHAKPCTWHPAKLIFDFTKAQGFSVVEVILWETDDSYAVYNGVEVTGA